MRRAAPLQNCRYSRQPWRVRLGVGCALLAWCSHVGAQDGSGLVNIRSNQPVNMAAVISMLSDMGGLNIVATAEVSAKNVLVNAKGLPAREVLRMISESNGLRMTTKEDGTLVLMTADEYAKVVGRSLDVKAYTLKHIPAADAVNVMKSALSSTGEIIASPATNQVIVMERPDLMPAVDHIVASIDTRLSTAVVELQYLTPNSAQELLKSVVQPPGRLSAAQEANCIVVTDIPVNIARAQEVLQQADIPPNLMTETFYLRYASCIEVGKVIGRMFAAERKEQSQQQSETSLSGGAQDREGYIPEQRQSTTTPQKIQIERKGAFPNTATASDKTSAPSGSAKTQPSESQPKTASRQPATEYYAIGHEGAVFVDARNNALIVTADPDLVARIRDVITAMDTEGRPFRYKFNYADLKTLDLESKLDQLLTTEAETYQIDAENSVVTFFAVPSKAELITEMLQTWDAQPLQITIEAELLSVSNSALKKMGVSFQARDAKKTLDDGTVLSNPFVDISLAPVIATGDALSEMTIGNLTLSDYVVTIRAIATDSSTRVISQPKITTLNHRPASFSDAREEPYTVVTVQGDTNTVLQDVRFINVGITLRVTPHVNEFDDVRLDIALQMSSLVEIRKDIPVVDTIEVQATSTTKDNRPVLLGGLKLQESTKNKNRVPVASRIPLLGALFRNRNDDSTDRQLMLVVTPHIARATQSEQMESDIKEMKDTVEVNTKEEP